ncbi:MAG: OmpA family protein [Treponema sp.]|jgi:outer membrane protein OmpA-like peptidoglycan-associated protein|nr:OmpA family protein [Treponema sp.]
MYHFILAFLFFCGFVSAQDGVLFRMERAAPYSFVERSDWSRYDNGKYLGHTYREVRASILPSQDDESETGFLYQGNFIVLEETLRDMRQNAKSVNMVVPARFRVNANGNYIIEEDNGFPSLRDFPVFPGIKTPIGSKWTAKGERAVDPLNSGRPAVVPIIAEYTYQGVEAYKGVDVYRIKAKFSSKNSAVGIVGADFIRMQDSHDVDILIRVKDGLLLFMRDQLDETFFLRDGSSVRFRGFTLIFTENIMPMNRKAVVTALDKTPEKSLPSLGEGIDITEAPEGVKLTIRDIRFKPDSDEFLPQETSRLDLIAQALKQIPDRTFLVEGHTASVGQQSSILDMSEMELSVRRAKRMISELSARGIAESRFLFKGWGGTKPLADNATEIGRAQNRRVEITILE